MDLRMRIKKPAGNADFLAMIKGFDLVFWISKSNSFPKEWMLMCIHYSISNVIIVTITDIMFDFVWLHSILFYISLHHSQDDDFDVIQTTFDPTLPLSPPRLWRRRSLQLSGLRSNVGLSEPQQPGPEIIWSQPEPEPERGWWLTPTGDWQESSNIGQILVQHYFIICV